MPVIRCDIFQFFILILKHLSGFGVFWTLGMFNLYFLARLKMGLLHGQSFLHVHT